MADAGDEPDVEEAIQSVVERLESADFTVAFRGYEPAAVNALMKRTADDLRRLLTPSTRVRAAAPTARDHDDEDSRPSRSGRDAAVIVHAARQEAERILTEAAARASELRAEAEAMRDEARSATLAAIRAASGLLNRGHPGPS